MAITFRKVAVIGILISLGLVFYIGVRSHQHGLHNPVVRVGTSIQRSNKPSTGIITQGTASKRIAVTSKPIAVTSKLIAVSRKLDDICFLTVKDEGECREICHYDTMCFYSYYYSSCPTSNCFTQLFYNDSQPDCQFQKTNDAILQQKSKELVDTYMAPYVIDTPKCHKPNYHPFDISLSKIVDRKSITRPYKCKKIHHQRRFQINAKDEISLIGSTAEREICKFRYIYRDDGYKNTDDFVSYTDWFPLTEDPTELTDEFVEVNCDKLGRQTYIDFSSHVPIALAKLKAQSMSSKPEIKIKSRKFAEDKISLMLFGLDSTSASQGYRQLPRTLGYIRQNMEGITVQGYNRMQDNTFMNIYTVLTGKPIEEGVGISLYRFFDEDPILFKWFRNDRFVTGYYEDYKTGTIFNWLKKGFHIKPTDHYFKPFAVAVENKVAKHWARDFCYLDKGVHVWLGDWKSSFVKKYSAINQPYFVFSWTTLLSHESGNTLGYGDLYYYKLLKDLHESGTLNNTILLFYSDHGYRYGGLRATKIGQHEENNPMMHWVIPQWFQNKYKKEMDIFRVNANNRLISPYDLHRTLLDFADGALESATAAGMEQFGKSLFEPIDEGRTCAEAGITDHYCSCRHAVLQPLDANLTKIAAQALVDRVNNITSIEPEKCLRYTLQYIKIAYRNHRHDISDDDLAEISVTIGMKPGAAEFSATVHVWKSNKKPAEVKGISRVSLYGSSADCVSDLRLRLYCSCKGLTPM